MSKLKKLETKKLLKELEFVESDYDFKNEVVSEADGEFLNSVTKFLEGHPQLKELFDQKINYKIDQMLKKKEDEIKELERAESERIGDTSNSIEGEETIIEEAIEEDIEKNEDTESNNKIRKLYREIVKLTHPDKVKSKKLNDYYIRATGFYDIKDLAGIYSICDELNIEYEVDESDNVLITDKITKLRDRIKFMESTFTWRWHYGVDQQDKDNVILTYIRMQLQ